MIEQQPISQGKAIRRTAALVLIGGAFGAGMVFRDPLMRLISPPAAIAESKTRPPSNCGRAVCTRR